MFVVSCHKLEDMTRKNEHVKIETKNENSPGVNKRDSAFIENSHHTELSAKQR